MKKFILSSLFLITSAHATTINLAPGSQIDIQPSDRATITCGGSSMGTKCRCLKDEYGRYWITYYENGYFKRGGEGGSDINLCELQMAKYSACQ